MNLKNVMMTALIAIFGSAAQAQVHTPPVMNLSDASCVATLGNRCVLRSPHRSLEMHLQLGQGLVANFKSAQGKPVSLTLNQDLLERVASGEITAEAATEISAELASFDGTAYDVPTIEELKAELGFPIEADLRREDLGDLMHAHVQLTLGVGPITAAYLSSRLGLEATDEVLPKQFEATALLDLSSASVTATSAPGSILDDVQDVSEDAASGAMSVPAATSSRN